MSAYGLRGQYEVPSEEYRIGRILSQEKGLYGMVSSEGEQTAAVSGKFRYTAASVSDFPVVGDFVLIDNGYTDNNAVIHRVLPRKSMFVRKAAGTGICEQVVASNIDTVFICMSLYCDFNLRRLERYLSAAWDSGAVPVIVLTKADLCDDVDYYVSKVRDISFGTDIITTSTSPDLSK